MLVKHISVHAETTQATVTVGNWALNKVTDQSSTDWPGQSSHAVDGCTTPTCECTLTDGQSEPWWAVDLGETVTVRQVVLLNTQTQGEYMHASDKQS